MKHLAPLITEHEIEVSNSFGMMPGKNVVDFVFDQIASADLILILASADYLSDNTEEIDTIKKSICFRSSKVVPIQISQCLWKEVFGNIMCLPKDLYYEQSPFDSSGFWHSVVLGVRDLIFNGGVFLNYKKPILARADSNTSHYSQENSSEIGKRLKLGFGEEWIEVQGDSMSPVFENGEILVGKIVEKDEFLNLIGRKSPCVVRTKTEGSFLKYILSLENSKLILASANKAHNDLKIDLSEVEGIYKIIFREIR
jgi:hypothetical protein